jgi:hypothetical protein
MFLASLLATYIPILHAFPWPVTSVTRLVMFFPLVLAVAIVYRTTRIQRVEDLPKGAAITFVNIVVGMFAIALGLWLAFQVALYFAT